MRETASCFLVFKAGDPRVANTGLFFQTSQTMNQREPLLVKSGNHHTNQILKKGNASGKPFIAKAGAKSAFAHAPERRQLDNLTEDELFPAVGIRSCIGIASETTE